MDGSACRWSRLTRRLLLPHQKRHSMVDSSRSLLRDRPSEPQATYTVQKITCESKGVVNVLHSRYSDASGMWFTNAKYDCNKGTLFTLAGGEAWEALSTRSVDYNGVTLWVALRRHR